MSYTANDLASSAKNNPWFAIALGLAGLILGFLLGQGSSGFPGAAANLQGNAVKQPTPTVQPAPAAPRPAPTPTAAKVPNLEGYAFIGDEDAPVVLAEWTDYECPFCDRYYKNTLPELKKLVDDGTLKIVFGNFPLNFHKNAQKASEATECAREQGGMDKFMAMHDMLFDKQSAWSRSADAVTTFKTFAADIGLNTSTFDSCLDNGDKAALVKKQMADGQSAGVSGTPGFLLYANGASEGENVKGAQPAKVFTTKIEALLDS